MECSISFDHHTYSLTQFSQLGLGKNAHWATSAQNFIKRWLAGQEHFSLSTSGSTGQPKSIKITRAQMTASALATITTLKLSEGTKALVCINTSFIGGQMMLVRAILGKWQMELVEPAMEVHQSAIGGQYDFAALVPLQVNAMLKSSEGVKFVNSIQKIIIGGAPLSESLEEKIQSLNTTCFHTYGMTETVSHIGLKKLNGSDKSGWFDIVGKNQLKLSAQGCLQIKGAVTDDEWILTNDLVEIKGDRFRWLGRADLVVNSGGIKVLIEEVENSINRLLPSQLSGTILLWKKGHPELGEELVGLSTNKATLEYIESNLSEIKDTLPKYHLPKTWFHTPAFQFTESGKIDRLSTFSSLNL